MPDGVLVFILDLSDPEKGTLKPEWENRPVVESLIFHSDRGVQYACDEFRKELSR
jgi:transposase InsO family protein